MGNVHMWLKVKRRFLLSVAIALPLAGFVKENAVTKHGTSAGEVDELLRNYDGKAAPATGADISTYAGQIKTAIEKQFYNPGEYSDKVCSLRIKLRNELKRKGVKTVIPRKSNEKMATDGRSQLDRDAYRNRNVVERCFGRLKEYRRIATRYDKTARYYLAMVKLGCIRLFYQRLCN